MDRSWICSITRPVPYANNEGFENDAAALVLAFDTHTSPIISLQVPSVDSPTLTENHIGYEMPRRSNSTPNTFGWKVGYSGGYVRDMLLLLEGESDNGAHAKTHDDSDISRCLVSMVALHKILEYEMLITGSRYPSPTNNSYMNGST